MHPSMPLKAQAAEKSVKVRWEFLDRSFMVPYDVNFPLL